MTVPMPGTGGLDAALAAVVDGARRFVEQLGTAPCLVLALAGPQTRAAFDLVWRDDVERDVLVTAVTTVALAVGADRLAAAVVGDVPDRPDLARPDRRAAIVGLTVTADGVVARRVLRFSPTAGGWEVGDPEPGGVGPGDMGSSGVGSSGVRPAGLGPADVRLGGDLGQLFVPAAAAFRADGAYVPLPAEVTAAYVNLREAGCVVRTDGPLTAS
ncbi:MAG TPA: hypothetical protein VHX40_02645 [Acidimicrobiales bacterium]|nr:hypothetical protein [Acidimicrobiales bacterium]